MSRGFVELDRRDRVGMCSADAQPADHLEVVWGALVAFVVVVLLTPAVGGMARMLGVVDRPAGGA